MVPQQAPRVLHSAGSSPGVYLGRQADALARQPSRSLPHCSLPAPLQAAAASTSTASRTACLWWAPMTARSTSARPPTPASTCRWVRLAAGASPGSAAWPLPVFVTRAGPPHQSCRAFLAAVGNMRLLCLHRRRTAQATACPCTRCAGTACTRAPSCLPAPTGRSSCGTRCCPRWGPS